MKRKHSELNGSSSATDANGDTTMEDSSSPVDFTVMGLDPRILQGIVKLKFAKPTLVQEKAVPLALEGKDILARAKTGSGKTAAYLLPVIHGILKKKELDDSPRIRALILVPSRELADQVTKSIEQLTLFCSKHVRAINIAQNVTEKVQTAFLSDSPEIVIATPARALKQLQLSDMTLFKDLEYFVIDEADLVMSYGYEDDMKELAGHLPKTVQSFMMSATLSDEVEKLKAAFCRNPVVLRLEEDVDEEGKLLQYCVRCAEDEKFLLTYVIFKLKLIRGKCIIFVGDVDRCYRLRLFLEQFGLKSCVLNSELPVNSRLHIVQEFNKDVYDIIIAADENEVIGDEDDDVPEKDESKPTTEGDGDLKEKPSKKKKRKPKKDKEFGVSRGIDFKNVSCVLNFDLPTSSKSYTHRVGRTARAGASGMALSFVIPKDKFGKHKNTTYAPCERDEEVIAKITKTQAKRGYEVKPYVFDMNQVNAFRYRMEDALRAVTKGAVREARTRELRQELIHSEKLKRHFEENPEDLKHLRHDGDLRPARVQAHLKHVPKYLLPGGAAAVAGEEGTPGFVPLRKPVENRVRKARVQKSFRGRGGGRGGFKRGGGGGGRDPLKTFKAGGKK